MERLDRVFAGLYLDACRAPDQNRRSAWQPLFALRAQPGTASLQYALAGMNAHINLDLGLVRTCRQLGRTLDSPGLRADFLAINGLLAAAVQGGARVLPRRVRPRRRSCSGTGVERPGGWNIEAARDAAWLSATVQWSLQGQLDAHAAYLSSRASIVGLVSAFWPAHVHPRSRGASLRRLRWAALLRAGQSFLSHASSPNKNAGPRRPPPTRPSVEAAGARLPASSWETRPTLRRRGAWAGVRVARATRIGSVAGGP